MKVFNLDKLPLHEDVETKSVLKKLAQAHSALAELKGLVYSIPNGAILINTLGLQEAKDSSAIENIVTTHDELYKAALNVGAVSSLASKEVQNYIAALRKGFALVSQNNILTINDIIKIQSVLESNNAGIRKVTGTTLKNAATGAVIYTPPQSHALILELLANLEQFINDDALSDLDPLVKMAIIHYQFESIHPFYDGNGRTGRIINVLFLVMEKLLDFPILYLSSYIIKHKAEYYKLLQEVRDAQNWEGWLLYMLDAVTYTAHESVTLIKEIQVLMLTYKHHIREHYKFYSQELLNNLFQHPYTKIELIAKDLDVSRITAASYLNQLTEGGILSKHKLGPANYFVNEKLYELLSKNRA